MTSPTRQFSNWWTWDVPLAYELKRRGCDIVALDVHDPNKTGFNVLRKISGFDIPYVRCSVYELSRFFKASDFDIVLYFGVFYHMVALKLFEAPAVGTHVPAIRAARGIRRRQRPVLSRQVCVLAKG